MTGKELKEKVDSLGISQKALADKLGVTPQSVNSIFTAKDIRTSSLERIAEVLSVSVCYFYGGDSYNTVTNNTNNIRKQTAHNISNGSGSITENAQPADDITRMLIEQNAALMKQVANLMEMLKAKM